MSQAVTADLDPRFAQPQRLFFGVGAQKSATSWLDKHLRTHPEVCMPVRKEQHYWTTRAPGAADRRAAWVEAHLAKIGKRGLWASLTRSKRGKARDEAWRRTATMLRHDAAGHRAYADVLFQSYAGQPVVGEVTPEYALLPAETLREMAALGRDVRFVMILRDPLDRLRSGLKQNLRKSKGADAVTAEGLAAHMAAAAEDLEDPNMRRSRYEATVRAFDAAGLADQVCYLFYETMFQQSEMDRLADFLGVARRPAPVARKVHPSAYGKLGFPAEVEARALAALAPTYDFVRARFGDAVPAKWARPTAPVGAAV